jgi:ferrous iron transport protein A
MPNEEKYVQQGNREEIAVFQFRNRYRGGFTASNNGPVTLTKMSDGQSGKIAQVLGGKGVTARLTALGIRQGQRITRIGGMYLRGPITIKVEKTQVAIGFGMAAKILIELEK